MNTSFDLVDQEVIAEDPQQRMPPRSALVALKPLGIGTPCRESLTSYFQRLADAHCVIPKVLAREFVIPQLGFNNRISETQADRFWRSSFFNGMGQVAQDWARVLGDLTSIKGLASLTLVPLRGSVGAQGTASPKRRWCPLCLEEGVRAGTPYGQLLWEIGCVTACPKHCVKLVDACGCPSGEKLNYRKAKFLPHICESCGESLVGRVDPELEAPSQDEVGLAHLVGNLLASPVFAGSLLEPKVNALAEFLNEAVRDIGEGNAECIAKILNVSKGGLSDWRHGRHLPSLPQAIHITRTFGATLAGVLEGTKYEGVQRVSPKSIHFRPRRAYYRRANAEGLDCRLEAILRANPPISVAETARRLGTSTKELYRLYKELAYAIAARAKVWKCEESINRRNARLQIVREIAEEMTAAGIIPTQKRLEDRICEIPKTFLFQERKACQQIYESVWGSVMGRPLH